MKLEKTKNWDFFKGGSSMIFVKNWQFFHLFILGKIGQENVFYDILYIKNAFLDYRNIKI